MTTFTPQTKSSVVTMTPQTKSSATLGRVVKAGYGWQYNQSGLTFDQVTDSITGLPVLYDSEGTLPTWTPLAKS